MASQPFQVSGSLGLRIVCSLDALCSSLSHLGSLPYPAGSQHLSQFSCDCTVPMRSSINMVPPIFLLSVLSLPPPLCTPSSSLYSGPTIKISTLYPTSFARALPEAHNDNPTVFEGRNQTIHKDFEDCFFISWSNKFKIANFLETLHARVLCQRLYLC